MRSATLALLAVLAAPASGQTCHDWDGDAVKGGWQCVTAADCEDRAWQRRPGALETCDGLDNDCDGSLDLGCDRYCDEPTLFAVPRTLEVAGLPRAIESGCGALTDDGFLAVSQRITGNTGIPYDTLLYARSYDRLGVPWAAAEAIGEPELASPFERWCSLAVGGDRALAAYQDGSSRNQETHRLMARVLDGRGRPLGPGPIDLSATAPIGSAPWIYQSAVWDGERFVVFWASAFARNNLLMSVVHPDGTAGNPETIIVTDDIDGNKTTIQDAEAVWTGSSFVVVVTVDIGGITPNLFTLEVTRDGTLVAQDAIPVHANPDVDLAMGDNRILVALSQRNFLWVRVHAAFLDDHGAYLANPGILTLLDEGNHQEADVRATWTGEMFGVVFSDLPDNARSDYWRWSFWRVLPDGTVLDPGGVVLDMGTHLREAQTVRWAGNDFWLFALRTGDLFTRERIVCSCQDDDADLFNACLAQDCDDADPMTHPFAVESCRGLADEDCDGLVDCDDPDCPEASGPADVMDLVWSGPGLAWSPVAGAERYDLARGLLTDLRRRGDLLQAECAGVELTSPSWSDDGRHPPAGDMLWYVVRPEGAPCALGSWGAAQVPRLVTSCR